MFQFEKKLQEAREKAINHIELAEGALGCMNLSLYGQEPRLVVDLYSFEDRVAVRSINTDDRSIDVLCMGNYVRVPYDRLSTDTLVACATYVKRMEAIYHNSDEQDPYYRVDRIFSQADAEEARQKA